MGGRVRASLRVPLEFKSFRFRCLNLFLLLVAPELIVVTLSEKYSHPHKDPMTDKRSETHQKYPYP